MTTKPKHRWYQFSLRTLGLVLTLCTVVAWLAHLQQRAAEQQRVVELLTLRYESEHYDPPVRYDFECAGLDAPQNVPSWLVNALGVDCFAEVTEARTNSFPKSAEERGAKGLHRYSTFRELKSLDLFAPDIRDDDLVVLNHHPRLETLHLLFTNVTGRGFQEASFRSNLRKLTLQGCPVDDEGLEAISHFENLEWLNLSIGNGGLRRQQFSSRGIEHLRQLPRLRSLILGGVDLTDEDLLQLSQLKHLEDLDLARDRKQSPEGILQLQQLRNLKRLILGHGFVVCIREGHQAQVIAVVAKMHGPEMKSVAYDSYRSELEKRLAPHATILSDYESFNEIVQPKGAIRYGNRRTGRGASTGTSTVEETVLQAELD
jgi:hypothetical protein